VFPDDCSHEATRTRNELRDVQYVPADQIGPLLVIEVPSEFYVGQLKRYRDEGLALL
jgi:hypothetical protein